MSGIQPGSKSPPRQEAPIVMVRWRDSIIFNDAMVWKPVSWAREHARVISDIEHVTVGLLLEETEGYVLVTHTIRVDGFCSNSISIPRPAIHEMKYMDFKKDDENDDS